MNVCWNMVIHRVPGYNKWQSVRAVVVGFGRVDVAHYSFAKLHFTNTFFT